ncbi:MAG: putative manganese-dependent inorganic diphosphatase [Lachnospiraceae bacterium]|nr:putative manganese-dependent inorganic diphosphatase [Lachnospiraceae bacterium]
MQDKVYVTGHQHPDTDSIASAIGYAFFKRAMGVNAVPCRLGEMNAESKYLLSRFGFEEPMLLTDARVRMSEITLDPPTHISPETTIFEALQLMEEEKHTYCGVVDEEGRLLGMVTKSNIAEIGLGDTAQSIGILVDTPVENFAKAVEGTVLYDDAQTHLNGKVSVIALAGSRVERYEIKDRIVIVGDDADAQAEIIRKGAGMLITVWTEKISDEVLSLAREHHCPVVLSGHGCMNTVRYLFFAPPVKLIMTTKLIKFTTNELAEDVGKKMQKSRFHIYPVVDPENRLVGYAARYHIMNAQNKKIILVDHNEFSQSVRAVEKAQVLEVIDHHRINDFSTSRPVSFRNEIVGSSATIVATIYRENQIPMPPNIAGLLLGALLSDTMDFHSPTTTPKDKETANILGALANLDIEEFAKEMFAVTSANGDKTMYEQLGVDFKLFDLQGVNTAISQIIVTDTAQIRRQSVAIQHAIDQFCKKKRLDLCVAAYTSILENGSIIFASGDRAEWAFEAFPNKKGEEHSFQKDILSRKSQILPRITEVVNRYV